MSKNKYNVLIFIYYSSFFVCLFVVCFRIAVDMGEGSVWVKMSTSWVVHLFYLWSLLAPVLFPDRDFGYGGSGSSDSYSSV